MGNCASVATDTSDAAPPRITVTANDSGLNDLPTAFQLHNQLGTLGNRKHVPVPFRKHFALAEWLDILVQLEQCCYRGGGKCYGPDPLLAPGQALAASLNASYTATRGVTFAFTSRAWHPDRQGQQFDRSFIVDASVGECCIRTQENTVHVTVPDGSKPGKPFEARVLDGQHIPVMCPKDAVAGQTVPVTLISPVLAPQQLTISVPVGATGGQIVRTALPGGGVTAVQLPADALPGQSLTFTAEHCVQLLPMRGRQMTVTVPADAKPGQTVRVAVPAGSKMVQVPAGCPPGAQMTITAQVPLEGL